MGRRTKLTPELQQQICDLLAMGNYADDVCDIVGIGETTFYRWLQEGEAGKEPYREFRESIKKAQAQAVARAVAGIQRAGLDGSWQALAWFLERRYPDKWGKRERVEHSDEMKPDLSFADDLDIDTLARIAKGEYIAPDEREDADLVAGESGAVGPGAGEGAY